MTMHQKIGLENTNVLFSYLNLSISGPAMSAFVHSPPGYKYLSSLALLSDMEASKPK